MQEAKTAAASRKKKSQAATGQSGHATAAALHHYESALQLLQQGKYERALAAFEKLLPNAPPELLERCRMYVATCRRQIERPHLDFATPEERYDYAVAQLNRGFYDEAREQLNAVVRHDNSAEFAFYGLALLDSITGRSQECLANLARAIELNPRNRLQARTDGDFQSMADDPRFTELLYPEVP
jgi:tetratricopeptide (TPR) repeat protein